MTELVIGCPIRKREWIIPEWFNHLDTALENTDLNDVSFAFVCGKDDQANIDMVLAEANSRGFPVKVGVVREHQREDNRSWSSERLHHMVGLRNKLLYIVRDMNPVHFLSFDSDILAHPMVIHNLLETRRFRGWDVVGGKAHMKVRGRCPSYGKWSPRNMLQRPDTDSVMTVDVVMAIKLMNHRAYHTDYVYHRGGEDIGICKEWKKKGYKLGWDGRCTSKHVMDRSKIHKFDQRCGW